MPADNSFRHQVYSDQRPAARYRLITTTEHDLVAGNRLMLSPETATLLRQARLDALVLTHGTFTGDDAFGIYREVGRLSRDVGKNLRASGKRIVDALAGDTGNYSADFESSAQDCFNSSGANCQVERFLWSGENHHLGRADAAVGLVDHLFDHWEQGRRRVLLWGHSHAGNVFALVTHLLGGSDEVVSKFFRAAGDLGKTRLGKSADAECWQRVQRRLAESSKRREIRPFIVTFGTPIRYGWETNGYRSLIHVVHHRAAEGVPEFRAPFPIQLEDLLVAKHGDYVQQIGIVGTNLLPYVLAWRSWRTERRLRQLLEAEVRRRDLFQNLRAGQRVAQEGTTLLVDYARTPNKIERQLFGHGIYTRTEWLPFHFDLVLRQMLEHAETA